MEQDNYNVARTKGGWVLILNGQVLASGMKKDRADQAAEVAARMSRARGRNAVLTHGDRSWPPGSLMREL
jgi:LDH2 family malate/lactate/ureidoglycolate dehydrogenase